MTRRWLPGLAALVWLLGCSTDEGATPVTSQDSEPSEPDVVLGVAAVPRSTPPTTIPTTTTIEVPAFSGVVRAATAADLGNSWWEGCPVGIEDLRWLDLTHWDDTGEAMLGSMVVHADHADDIVSVFERLFEAGFPVHSIRPITEFDNDDEMSMTANNSSAFNCREIAGRPGVWSQHAYGGAIDINPLVNPWVRGDRVSPSAGAPYVERTTPVTGMIVAGDVVTEAFADIGWGWGGDWNSTLDYQHFSHNGR